MNCLGDHELPRATARGFYNRQLHSGFSPNIQISGYPTNIVIDKNGK